MIKFLKKEKEFQHHYQQSDFFLAEFPKSGVTWLSNLVTALELMQTYRGVTSLESQRIPIGHGMRTSIVSDDTLPVDLCPVRSKIFGGRMIKTHSENRPYHQRCVYLYRHPGQVMASYWSMLIAEGVIEKKITFEKFCLHPLYGLRAWKKHIQSWIHHSSYVAVIAFISYEALCLDAVSALRSILSIFGVQIPEATLNEAVLISDRAVMQQAEQFAHQNDIRRAVRFDKKYQFIGNSGRSLELASTIDAMVQEICQEELSLLYPKGVRKGDRKKLGSV